jgi:hypothetical protein
MALVREEEAGEHEKADLEYSAREWRVSSKRHGQSPEFVQSLWNSRESLLYIQK